MLVAVMLSVTILCVINAFRSLSKVSLCWMPLGWVSWRRQNDLFGSQSHRRFSNGRSTHTFHALHPLLHLSLTFGNITHTLPHTHTLSRSPPLPLSLSHPAHGLYFCFSLSHTDTHFGVASIGSLVSCSPVWQRRYQYNGKNVNKFLKIGRKINNKHLFGK